jgi:hypothetical protein
MRRRKIYVSSHADGHIHPPTTITHNVSVHAWKHRFASECMSVVHDQAFGAKTPTYATVLQLDRKLRAFPVPQALQVVGFGSSSAGPTDVHYSESVMLMLQRHIVLAIREMSELILKPNFDDITAVPLYRYIKPRSRCADTASPHQISYTSTGVSLHVP